MKLYWGQNQSEKCGRRPGISSLHLGTAQENKEINRFCPVWCVRVGFTVLRQLGIQQKVIIWDHCPASAFAKGIGAQVPGRFHI